MARRVIKTDADLTNITTLLEGLKKPFTLEWVLGHDRTGEQNALQWMWARDVADQTGEDSQSVQAGWKLRHGIPIWRECSAEFRAVYDLHIRPLGYEEKIEYIKITSMPMTRIFKVPQMIRYMDAIQRECTEAGIMITQPDPELVSYQKRYRQKDGPQPQ